MYYFLPHTQQPPGIDGSASHVISGMDSMIDIFHTTIELQFT